MSVITEYRLKCEYCPNVSPVIEHAGIYPKPWIAADVPNYPMALIPQRLTHFCCQLHLDKWLAEQEQTA